MSASILSGTRTHEKQTLLHRVHSELSLRWLSRRERLALGAICLCTLVLLAAFQHGRVFMGDEIGTLKHLKKSSTYILTHFDTWLSMNYFILVERWVSRLCRAMDWRLTLLPLAAAVATIPLTASLALKFTGSTRTGLIAATLAAFNFYLVYWGPVIRAYSLLVAFSLLAMNEFFHWYRERDWWSGVRCAAAVLLLLLTHLNGVYTVAFLVLLLLAESVSAGVSNGGRILWKARTLWIPLAGVAIVVGVAYWRLVPEIARVNRDFTETPPTSLAYLPAVFTGFMGVGRAGFLCALLLLAGCWSALREKRALLLLCGAIILAPILMSLQGVSVATSAFARYLICSLPLLLILMAEGIDWLARHVRIRGGAAITAWGITALVVWCWTPYVRNEFLDKRQWPYGQVANFLHSQMQTNDVIVAGWAMGFTLSQFFDHPENCIMPPDKYLNKVANHLDAPAPGRVFYVTGEWTWNGPKAHVQQFGRVQVATYSGATARVLLQEWREDLLSRTADRVFFPLEGDYQLLALLEEQLLSGQSADHWRSLAERCHDQSPAARELPRRLENTARAVIFP